MGLPTLSATEAKRVVALYHAGWGPKAITDELAKEQIYCEMHVVRNILRGRSHRKVTGGRIMQGSRPKSELAYYKKQRSLKPIKDNDKANRIPPT